MEVARSSNNFFFRRRNYWSMNGIIGILCRNMMFVCVNNNNIFIGGKIVSSSHKKHEIRKI